jgi:hypothetical protein
VTGPPPTMAVLHLDTGHVVAAAAADGAPATVESLTGGSHVAVLIAPGKVVEVPSVMLTATTLDRDHDVLAAPTSYLVVAAPPRLSFVGAPVSMPGPPVVGTPGKEAVVIWQVGSRAEVTRVAPAADGSVSVTTPAMASHGLVAVPGLPIYAKT